MTIPPNEINLTYLHAFLTSDECTELISLSQGLFSRSLTALGIHADRTSHSAHPSSSANANGRGDVMHRVRKRVTELTGAHSTRIQGPTVVRYEPGQQFKPHFDSGLDFATHKCLREFSFFAYLNTLSPDAGGETEFTKIGVKFTPKGGRCTLLAQPQGPSFAALPGRRARWLSSAQRHQVRSVSVRLDRNAQRPKR